MDVRGFESGDSGLKGVCLLAVSLFNLLLADARFGEANFPALGPEMATFTVTPIG